MFKRQREEERQTPQRKKSAPAPDAISVTSIDAAAHLIDEWLVLDEELSFDPHFRDSAISGRVGQVGEDSHGSNYRPSDSSLEIGPVRVFPRTVSEKLAKRECSSFMGLFPEIDCAWITVDNVLYLWSIEDPHVFTTWDGVDQVIVSVGLVPPVPGLFVKSVRYILVVATPVEVVLLAVKKKVAKLDRRDGIRSGDDRSSRSRSLEDGERTEEDAFEEDDRNADSSDARSLTSSDGIRSVDNSSRSSFGSFVRESGHSTRRWFIQPTKLSVPTDGVSMLAIVGTASGRIFMGGKDGHLYEVVYEAKDGWFRKRCRKISHTQSFLSLLLPSFLSPFASSSGRDTDVGNGDHGLALACHQSKSVLFALRYEDGVVWCYDIWGSSGTLHEIGRIRDILSKARQLCPRLPKEDKVVDIFAVDNMGHIHAIVVTMSGARIYLTTDEITPYDRNAANRAPILSVRSSSVPGVSTAYNTNATMVKTGDLPSSSYYRESFSRSQTPHTLAIHHVRLSPGLVAAALTNASAARGTSDGLGVQSPRDSRSIFASTSRDSTKMVIECAYIREGVTILCDASHEVYDQLYVLRQEGSMEFVSSPAREPRVWAIDERWWIRSVMNTLPPYADSWLWESACGGGRMTRAQLLCLSEQGLRTFILRHPARILEDLLRVGKVTAALDSFVDQFGVDANAWMLALIARSVVRDATSGGGTTAPTWAFYHYAGQPKWVDDVASGLGHVKFSDAHAGLVRYIGRLLKPLWNTSLIEILSVPQVYIWMNCTYEGLKGLDMFLSKQRAFGQGALDSREGGRGKYATQGSSRRRNTGAGRDTNSASDEEEDPRATEQQSVGQLLELVQVAVQGVAFLSEISRYSFVFFDTGKSANSSGGMNLFSLLDSKNGWSASSLLQPSSFLSNLSYGNRSGNDSVRGGLGTQWIGPVLESVWTFVRDHTLEVDEEDDDWEDEAGSVDSTASKYGDGNNASDYSGSGLGVRGNLWDNGTEYRSSRESADESSSRKSGPRGRYYHMSKTPVSWIRGVKIWDIWLQPSLIGLIVDHVVAVGCASAEEGVEFSSKIRKVCPNLFAESDRIRVLAESKIREVIPHPQEKLGAILTPAAKDPDAAVDGAVKLLLRDVIPSGGEVRTALKLLVHVGAVDSAVRVVLAAGMSAESLPWILEAMLARTLQLEKSGDSLSTSSDSSASANNDDLLILPGAWSGEDWRGVCTRVWKRLLSAADPSDLQQVVFRWFTEKQRMSDLVEAASTMPRCQALETFLLNESRSSAYGLSLISAYYTRKSRMPEATKCLLAVADRGYDGVLTLKERCEALNRAVLMSRTCPADLRKEAEERREVAAIQMAAQDELRHRIEDFGDVNETDSDDKDKDAMAKAVEALNDRLWDNSTLYNRVAVPFQLWETQLAIICVSQYPEGARMAAECWDAIISEALRKLTVNGTSQELTADTVGALIDRVAAVIHRQTATLGSSLNDLVASSHVSGTGYSAQFMLPVSRFVLMLEKMYLDSTVVADPNESLDGNSVNHAAESNKDSDLDQASFVWRTLRRSMELPYGDLFDAYKGLISTEKQSRIKLHLLLAFVSLLRTWYDEVRMAKSQSSSTSSSVIASFRSKQVPATVDDALSILENSVVRSQGSVDSSKAIVAKKLLESVRKDLERFASSSYSK